MEHEIAYPVMDEMPDCELCEPAEPWSQPNKGFVVVINKLTGRKVHVCGGCVEAGIPREFFVGEPPERHRAPMGELVRSVVKRE